jgi:dipeptidyl aminopeptidase/acylaminoacyl peptidase
MVQCYFDKQLISQVSQLNKGDSITVKGHLRGLFVNVLVDKCSLVLPTSDNTKEDSDLRKISINSTYEQRVYERAGNIYLKDSSNNQIQLTTSGNNSNSALSPDGSLVTFVHQTSDKPIEDSLGEKVSPTEIWIVNIGNKEARKIVDKNAVQQIKEVQAIFGGPQFGYDSKTIFFISSAYATSGAVLKVDLISRKVAYLCAGNSVEVIRTGEYIGNLKINQHRYQRDGAHDCDYIFSPDGTEIKVIKESCDPPL